MPVEKNTNNTKTIKTNLEATARYYTDLLMSPEKCLIEHFKEHNYEIVEDANMNIVDILEPLNNGKKQSILVDEYDTADEYFNWNYFGEVSSASDYIINKAINIDITIAYEKLPKIDYKSSRLIMSTGGPKTIINTKDNVITVILGSNKLTRYYVDNIDLDDNMQMDIARMNNEL